MLKIKKIGFGISVTAITLLGFACAPTIEYVEVPVEVIKEIPVETIVEVETIREVPVEIEVVREVEVIKEVPVEVEVEVIREVEKPIDPYVPMYLDYVKWTSSTEDQIMFSSSQGYIDDVAWTRPLKFNYRTENNDLWLEIAIDVNNHYDSIVGVDVLDDNFYLVTRDNEVIQSSSSGWTGTNICNDLQTISNDGQCWIYFEAATNFERQPKWTSVCVAL